MSRTVDLPHLVATPICWVGAMLAAAGEGTLGARSCTGSVGDAATVRIATRLP